MSLKIFRALSLLLFALNLPLHAQRWVGSWAASQQIPTGTSTLEADALQGVTLRQLVHLSVGGERLRVRVSNTFGTAPLHLAEVHIATPTSTKGAAIDPATDRSLRFDGKTDVTIPAGAEYLSDPIVFHVAPMAELAITIRYVDAPAVQTSHPGSRATSYLSHTATVNAATMPDAKTFEHWFQISGVELETTSNAMAVVTLGDSITDGHGATDNGNDRWPDDLAARLQKDAKLRLRAVLNAGLGGNRVLLDGQGPNALARFDRDVLAQSGVRYVIVFEGVNDLGMSTKEGEITPEEHAALVAHITGAYQQMIDRAHAAGMKIYGATITPYQDFDFYHPTTKNEADRQAINAWIRMPGHYDAVLDFDHIVADPANPARLLPKFDSGDHIHPNAMAYHAIADSIPLALFAQ